MAFGWLGTFRQGSWQAYRRFILEERRDVSARLAVIDAELTRIGKVTTFYRKSTDAEGKTTVSEERVGFAVDPASSLGKLMQVYVAMGGNPFDISLFLKPDAAVLLDSTDDENLQGADVQPHGGVVSPQSASYTSGGVYQGGWATIKKYIPARTGGRTYIADSTDATLVDQSRRWASQEIRFKRNDLEARIIKLCDLREQLQEEQDRITWAVAGVVPDVPVVDGDQFTPELTTANIVATIDGLFYETEDGRADFETVNVPNLTKHPNLLTDLLPDESNTAL